MVADNFPVLNGRNIVVDAQGYVRNTKSGCIWTDDRGEKHAITQKSSEEIGTEKK